MNEKIIEALALIIPLVFAIVFHEVAHGLMARALGDRTAEEMNRLSLNPLRHVDPVGTVLLPGFLALVHAPVFGWAKPVPVNALRLRNPKRDMMLVGAAGPGMNLIMAAVAALLLGLALRPFGGGLDPSAITLFMIKNLTNFIEINVFLALFNLLPIPPFDGSHIVEGLLPDSMARAYARMRGFGMLIPIVLLIVLPSLLPGFSVTQYLFAPVDWVLGKYSLLTGFAAGV
jgi:Zn-dependent protease